jgi:hypothetical protein
MRVEPGRDEHELRLELIQNRKSHRLEHRLDIGVRRAGFEGQVHREARASSSTDVRCSTGPWVERELVRGHEEHGRVVVERPLRAVAVVHVVVDDCHSLDAVGSRVRRRQCHRVEEAEAHGAIAFRMVARRARQDERPRPGRTSQRANSCVDGDV